ncbi:hypothetical protein WA158_004391 [Blastocystis sp. Blastoise]
MQAKGKKGKNDKNTKSLLLFIPPVWKPRKWVKKSVQRGLFTVSKWVPETQQEPTEISQTIYNQALVKQKEYDSQLKLSKRITKNPKVIRTSLRVKESRNGNNDDVSVVTSSIRDDEYDNETSTVADTNYSDNQSSRYDVDYDSVSLMPSEDDNETSISGISPSVDF